MADLAQMTQEVLLKVPRPELVGEIQLEIRSATLEAHLLDFWLRDRFERSVLFQTVNTKFQIDVPATLERFRKLAYIKPYDQVAGEVFGRDLIEVSPNDLFNQFGLVKGNVFYMAGTTLNIRMAGNLSAFLVGWYKYPDVRIGQYNSWIADMLPQIITEKAAGKIMIATGMVEEGNRFLARCSIAPNGLEGELVRMLRMQDTEALAR